MGRDILKEIEGKLENLHKMYDVMRLVDPMSKKVIGYSCSSLNETQELCYDYWQNGQICDNCISIRAYQENRCYIKLEQNQDEVFLVQAVPIENAERPLVLEMLKNASETMLIGSGDDTGENFNNYIKRINEMITKDHLTKLYNRRYVDERLPADVAYAILNERSLSVCFIDMDNLTLLNNQYGHDVGDKALQTVGDILKNQIRESQDWAARYGGDEFLICLNNTEERQAAMIAQRVLKTIEATPLVFGNDQIPLSVTCGVSCLGEPLVTAQELINGADQRMYVEKRKKHLE